MKKRTLLLSICLFATVSGNFVAQGSGARDQSEWQELTLPDKYFGVWKIYSRESSRNDVEINSQSIMDGLVNMKIIRTYYRDGVYKVMTTLNNYYQVHYIKDRVGGIGNGGIYINSTNSQAFRSEAEAFDLKIPAQLDSGYR